MLTLQEKLTSSNLEVIRLTENNQLLSNQLINMEKELAAFKQYVENDEDAKQEIQEFIEIQRQFNALLNADNQFSWDKLATNSLVFTLFVVISAAILLALITFFFTHRSNKKDKKVSLKETPLFAIPVTNTPDSLSPPLSSSAPILSTEDKVEKKVPELINESEAIEKKQAILDKEKIKEVSDEIKVTPAFKTERDEKQEQTLYILFDDEHENISKEDPLVKKSTDSIQESNDEKQVSEKNKDKTNADYVVGLDKDELIDLNEMAEFNEEDALQAVLAENAHSEIDDMALNDGTKIDSDKKNTPFSTLVDLDELAQDSLKASTSPQNEVSMSTKSDDYQAVLDTVDFNFKNKDFSLQMDLAKAHIEMQDFEGAVELLEQVLRSSDPTLQQQAKEMLIMLK